MLTPMYTFVFRTLLIVSLATPALVDARWYFRTTSSLVAIE